MGLEWWSSLFRIIKPMRKRPILSLSGFVINLTIPYCGMIRYDKWTMYRICSVILICDHLVPSIKWTDQSRRKFRHQTNAPKRYTPVAYSEGNTWNGVYKWNDKHIFSSNLVCCLYIEPLLVVACLPAVTHTSLYLLCKLNHWLR